MANVHEAFFQCFHIHHSSPAVQALAKISSEDMTDEELGRAIRRALALSPAIAADQLALELEELDHKLLGPPLAASLQDSTILRHLCINHSGAKAVSGNAWKTLAGIIKHNISLRRLSMEGYSTMAHDSALVWAKLLAEGLRHNTSLEYVDMFLSGYCYDDEMLAEMDLAFAEAITHNTVLQGMRVSPMLFGSAMSEALMKNTSLVDVDLGNHFSRVIDRNKELHKLCCSLSQLAKVSSGFHSLKDIEVRRMVFARFIPDGCIPAQFFRNMMIDHSGLQNSACIDDVCSAPCPVAQVPAMVSGFAIGSNSAAGEELEGKSDNADITDVLLRSKQDGPPPLSGDGQTIFNLPVLHVSMTLPKLY